MSEPHDRQLTEHTQAFENTSTNVAAAQMRNALTNLAETVKDPKEKKVGTTRCGRHGIIHRQTWQLR